MAGRQFAAANKTPPACITRMGETVPACFDAKQWGLYLHEVWRQSLNRPAELARLERGARPDFCSDCSYAYRLAMTEAGRCNPPAGADAPPLEQVPSLPACGPVSHGSAAGAFSSDPAGELHMDRSNPAARVAGTVAAEASGRQQRVSEYGASGLPQPEPDGNARAGDASPLASGRRGSAEEGEGNAA